MKSNIQTQDGPEEIIASGRILEFVKIPMKLEDRKVIFEIARRAPGVRLIIKNKQNQYLITKEFRYEIKDYDYRLPGGKVFDKLENYKQIRNNKTQLKNASKAAAIKECQEETGYTPIKTELIHISKCGTTIDWDLYYFLITVDQDNQKEQSLEDGENTRKSKISCAENLGFSCIKIEWKTKEELLKLTLNNQIKEDRSAAVILRLLLNEDS